MTRTLNFNELAPAGYAAIAASLNRGGLVCLPSDTVYGLACLPAHRQAVRRIYQAKGRGFDKPLALVFRDTDEVFSMITGLPGAIREAAGRFLPGPVTLIIPAPAGELAGLDVIKGGSVGIRVVPPPVGEIYRMLPAPLAVTSANLSGEPDPGSVEEIPEAIKDACDFIIDSGPTTHRCASTIVDLRPLAKTGRPRVIREGPLSQADVEEVLR